MKIIKILVTSILVSTVMFGALPVFAEDVKPDTSTDLKVYYSEELAGGGEKVFHITACSKARTYAPLRCIMKKKETPYFDEAGNCLKQGAEDGDLIKGCIKEGETIPGTDYPAVDTSLFWVKSPDGCSDAPAKQGNYYALTWGIVDKKSDGNDSNNGDEYGPKEEGKEESSKWQLKGTVVWPESSSVDPEYIKKEFNNGKDTPKLEAVLMYHSALCVTYDVISTNKKKEPIGEITGRVKELYDSVEKSGEALITAGCNNDNSGESTAFNLIPAVRCSTMYRISGKTGTDIFGQYIGALYRWAAGVVGIVAVLIIVFSGIQMSMAGGDSAKLDSAKNRIMQSIIGIVILLLSALILYTINPTFFT